MKYDNSEQWLHPLNNETTKQHQQLHSLHWQLKIEKASKISYDQTHSIQFSQSVSNIYIAQQQQQQQ